MRQKNLQIQRGFTLVEILVVVAILGLLIGLAVPSFLKVRRMAKVTGAANRVYTSITKARNLAMRKQRPIIIKVNITANNLQFLACLDADNATVPGANNPTTFTCDANDTALSAVDTPFPGGTLTINNTVRTENNVAIGPPKTDSSFNSTQPSNLTALNVTTGVAWFGFDSSGKLIPDGRTPYASTADVTNLPRYPAIAGANNGGPEFYFAEFNANLNTRTSSHVYRKVEILMLGNVRVQQWPPGGASWTGVR